MARKHEQVEDDDVSVALEEETELGPQHNAGKQHDAKLEHDEASELRGRGRANGEAGLCELVDLRGKRTHLHGREVTKEVARRLDGHEVAKAHWGVVVQIDRRDIGERAEQEVQAHADNRPHEPSHLEVGERRDTPVNLAGEEQERHIGAKDKADELGAARGLLLIRIGGLLLRCRPMPARGRTGDSRLGSVDLAHGLLGHDVVRPSAGARRVRRVVFGLCHGAPVFMRSAAARANLQNSTAPITHGRRHAASAPGMNKRAPGHKTRRPRRRCIWRRRDYSAACCARSTAATLVR